MSGDYSAVRRWHPILWGLIGLALVLRLAWGLSRPTSDESLAALPDQVEYVTLGRSLLHGQGLSFVDPRFTARVYAYRMPGYPAFIAACGGNLRIIRMAQAVIDTGTVFATFLLATSVMPAGARLPPLLTAALVAVNPLLIYFSGLILSESLFVAMLIWGMVLLVTGFESERRRGRAWVWLLGGILLALAILVRPSAALLPVILGLGALFVNHRTPSAYTISSQTNRAGRWPLPIGTTMIVLVGLALTPWALRNYRVFHQLIWTDTNSGITLYDGFNSDATGASDQRFVRYMPQLRLMDELSRSQYLTILASEFIEKHPREAAALALEKIERTWSPMPLSDQFGSPLYITIALFYSIPFDLLVLYGLWMGSVRRPAKIFLLLPALYLTLIHALSIGSLRYRLPAEPALAVLAACAFVRTAPAWKRDDSKLSTECSMKSAK